MLSEAPKSVKSFRDFVSDIKQVDNRITHWRLPLDEYMKEIGFNRLGEGKYGVVYGKQGYPWVIKVFMKDTAYLKWLDFCMKNQNNKHIPKIRGKVVKVSSHFMAVRIEKLERVRSPYASRFLDMIENPDAYENELARDRDTRIIADFLDKNKRLTDLHYDNIMERPNGDLVIIDACYNWRRNDKFTIDAENIEKFKEVF